MNQSWFDGRVDAGQVFSFRLESKNFGSRIEFYLVSKESTTLKVGAEP